MQFCMLHLSLQTGSTTTDPFSPSIQYRNGCRNIATEPVLAMMSPLAIPTVFLLSFHQIQPFTEAGIRLLFAPGAVSLSRHWNEYARWKDCSLVKGCALFCLLNNHWCLCKRDFSKNTSSLAGLQAVKRNPTATTKSPVFSRQSYFS